MMHPWEWPPKPWERVNLDFAVSFPGHNYLVAVDAHSKWPEVEILKSTTVEQTIEVLRRIFARNVLPEQIAVVDLTVARLLFTLPFFKWVHIFSII